MFANNTFFSRPFLDEGRDSEETVVEVLVRVPDLFSPEWEEEELERVSDQVSPEWEVEDEGYEDMLSDIDRGTEVPLVLDGDR